MNHADLVIGNAILAVVYAAVIWAVLGALWPWDLLGRPKKKGRQKT